MSDLLFAVPWWLPTLLGIIGIFRFITGPPTQAARVRNAGLGVVLLAIIWALVSYLVDTDKEKVEKKMTQTIQAVMEGDWNHFKSNLTPAAGFSIGSMSITGAYKVT